MTTTTARRAKKNLKEDQLVTTTFRLTEWAQAHFNQVIIGVVALVAVVAVLVFVANSRESGAGRIRHRQDQLPAGQRTFRRRAGRLGALLQGRVRAQAERLQSRRR